MFLETQGLKDLQTLVSMSKQRGFVYQSSEIYGGLNSCWDYGPLGAQLKMNIKRAWWETMTRRRDVVGLDAAILMHPTVWKASGHVDNFSDPMVDCRSCKARHRADHLESNVCPNCGSKDLTEPRSFNLMFKTHMGPVEDEGSVVYMRPETAQGIFVNFENVQSSMRRKLPFGIAQIGKSFRNEITPGNFIFRTREFEQMEMQYFVTPGEDDKFYDQWKEWRMQFYRNIGINEKNLRFKPHGLDELAHYAKAAEDIQYLFPMGWSELEGIHNRTNFDLSQHAKFSGKKIEYFDEAKKEKYVPYVIETAVGCDRLVLAALCDAYTEEQVGEGDTRTVLKFHPRLAPVKAAVLPLSKKEPLIEVADKIFATLSESVETQYDESGSIGKRYRRQDEIGTPFCVTVDFDTLEDKQVTVRSRDSMAQERISIDQLSRYVNDKILAKL
ncbi:MAG: glycine--tRNA ligase [Bdellovibrionaceae bacterium]|nr:glycine--tRNA ligase [Pseudobdellovibrionaceae bacterium]